MHCVSNAYCFSYGKHQVYNEKVMRWFYNHLLVSSSGRSCISLILRLPAKRKTNLVNVSVQSIGRQEGVVRTYG